MNIKQELSNLIDLKIDGVNYQDLITLVQDSSLGDYCLPCFSLAKILHKAPNQIAMQLQSALKASQLVQKAEVVNGYLNFYLNKEYVTKNVLSLAYSGNNFYTDQEFAGQTVCIDYSSVNLAKYMHIGHLSTTMIGESIARLLEAKGYKVVRINYVGDFGTPFGMMMYAYLNWGFEEELNARGVDYLQDLYVEFHKRAEEDASLEEQARAYAKLIEQHDPKVYGIYQKFIDISKGEAKSLLDQLGVKFDSWQGESYYTSLMPQTIKELEQKNLLISSLGTRGVNLEDYNLGYCIIEKSDGSSLYITRDITAAIDRQKEYSFNKMFYVTAVQQKLHFEQLFKVLELMGYSFSKNLQHIYYGMFSLPTGKIASRKGKQAVLKDLMAYAYNKAYSIVQNREFTIESKDEVARKIAMSALKFNALKNERIKDTVFDIENCFNFDGDTSAYLQYSYARICSIIRKAGTCDFSNINYSHLLTEDAYSLVLALNQYKSKLESAINLLEPSVISKYALDLCKLVNRYYTTNKVITSSPEETTAKVFLLTIIKNTLSRLFNLICIDTVEEM